MNQQSGDVFSRRSETKTRMLTGGRIGYRVWLYEPLHGSLRGPVFGGQWGPAEQFFGSCRRGDHRPHPDQPVPECDCGLYAFDTAKEALAFGARVRSRRKGRGVLGLVRGHTAMAGRVGTGWRAVSMEILGFSPVMDVTGWWADRDRLAQLSDLYSVPLVAFRWLIMYAQELAG
jgi:hypothetical protein